MSRRSFPVLLFALLLPLLLPSCQTAKKSKKDAENNLLLGALNPGEEVSEETLERLREIANDPASNLDVAGDAGPAGEEGTRIAGGEADLRFPGGNVFDPVTAWKKPGLNPRSISPGDIFSENDGPILNKSFSLADSFSEEERRQLFQGFTTMGNMRVPMTISVEELAELRQKAASRGETVDLPSRSVAVDFRALTYSSDQSKLEDLLASLSGAGGPDESFSFRFPETTTQQLAEIKKKLEAGEKLYVITSVTESSQLKATYPGAPVGKRDAGPIQNALLEMYPHLGSLQATKQDRSILLSGTPRVLWEFEARELKLKGDRLVIDDSSLVQL